MRQTFHILRERLDGFGVLLSGLCALHCILGIVLVGILGLGGQALLAPEVHHYGLALALLVGVISLGFGAFRHGRVEPMIIGAAGLAMMGAALFVGHGMPEAVLTVLGVGLVAVAHIRNLHGGNLHKSA